MVKSNLELKEVYLKKLKDIQDSCDVLVEKVEYLQLDLHKHPDWPLEKALGQLNNDFSNIRIFISELCHDYIQQVADLKN